MGCTNPNIPSYLHYNQGMKTFPCWRFAFWHLIYRIGHKGNANPIDADKMNTGYSVCWSKLINHSDVLKAVLEVNPKLGNAVYFGKVKEFKKVVVNSHSDTGLYQGEHIVKTKLHHKPLSCNYSHSEILIEHTYFENNKKQTKILQYDDWKNSLFKVGKPPLFYKSLKASYRAKVFTILNSELNHSNLPLYLKFHPKIFFVKCMLYFNLR